jgi:hypothetical protein
MAVLPMRNTEETAIIVGSQNQNSDDAPQAASGRATVTHGQDMNAH